MTDALPSVIIDSSQKTVIISAASIPTVLSANWKLVLLAGLHAAPVNTKNSFQFLYRFNGIITECNGMFSVVSICSQEEGPHVLTVDLFKFAHLGYTFPPSSSSPAPLNLFTLGSSGAGPDPPPPTALTSSNLFTV